MTTMLYQGHGSYRFTTNDGMVIYVDPFAGVGYDVPADLILVTHEHFDHNQVDKVPQAEGCLVLRAAQLHPAPGEYQSGSADDVRVMPVPAYNHHHEADECMGVLLNFDGLSFYVTGDTGITQKMESGWFELLDLDYAVFPCDGVYTMTVEEASRAAKLVGAKHSIPVHTVPMDDPNDPAQLFNRETAEGFQAEGRIILEPGQELQL